MKMKNFRKLFALLITAVLLFAAVIPAASATYETTLWITQDLQPSYTVQSGKSITLTVAAYGGNGTISYQWYSGNGLALNCSSSSITFTVSGSDTIYCVVRSGSQMVESTHAVLNVVGGGTTPTATPVYDPTAPVTTPTIVVQPKSITLPLGQSGTLSVQATCAWINAGVGLKYQWYYNVNNNMQYAREISGATSATYTVPASYTNSKMYYTCAVTSTNGVDESSPVYTDVVSVYTGELNITKHPTGETVQAGSKASFVARADGAVAFQWRIVRNDGSNSFYRADEAPSYINGLQVYGADSETLTLSNIPASMNGMTIICVFYADTARTQFKITNSALLTVTNPTPTAAPSSYIPSAVTTPVPSTVPVVPSAATILAPTIAVQPEGAVLTQDKSTSLAVTAVDDNATGTTLKYQWYKNDKNSNANGTAIAGAQSASYVPEKINGSKYYYVGVWATDGSKTSKVVYSSPVAVTYNEVTATPTPTVAPTAAPSKNSDKSLLSQLALPLIAMLVAAAVGIGAFIVLKKTNSDNDYRDDRRGRAGRNGRRDYRDDRYDDYDD